MRSFLRLSDGISVASLVVALAASAASTSALAVVTANGRNVTLPDSLSLDGVGQLSNGCSSVLIGGGWMLGAAHCAGGVGGTVAFGNGTVATIVESRISPDYGGVAVHDLSLMRLDAVPAGLIGYQVQTAAADGRTVLLAGYGRGGTGGSGDTLAGGTLRYGYNQYESLLPDDPETSYYGLVVGFDFDDGSRVANSFGSPGRGKEEASLAAGDSGGPSFSFSNGVWSVVGIHVAIADGRGTGFGGIGYDMLLDENSVPWIARVTAVPEPSAAWLLLAGVGMVAAIKHSRR